MAARRTDLALEAHELHRGAAETLSGVRTAERERRGYGVHVVEVRSREAARALGKPMGVYVTLDL
ncbi:MAG: GPR endopeptidase, partial [Oscillospiraceae bacterium]|nr:GPR endopeptidase [Oscillospiraceae bacterium]